MKTKRVLICDDDKDVLNYLEEILTEMNWEVVCSESASNIIGKIETAKPSVIIMDNWLPGEGGVTAIKKIKEHPVFNKIPVVFITGSEHISSLASYAGADLYLQKPVTTDSLTQILDEALELALD
ncbi:MAG TPA: response regulator [Sphingobacteriaceae bacterium]|nr:response regulator [Sphingobacteriaceae bacterium]